MARIDKLTPEQIARFKDWSEDWIKIGLSTEPANFDKATAAALKAYRLINRDRPTIVLRMSSPYGATLGGAIAWAMLRELGNGQVGSQVRSQVRGAAYNYRGGSLWASWGAYVSFFRDVCGWSDPVLERFEIDEDLVRNCGWVWWHENVLAISDRPAVINRDEQGRLHSEVGPSIAYRDGWRLHHWRGTSVPADWIEKRADLSPNTVIKAQNVEQRAAGAAIVGWPKMLSVLKSKTVDKHDNPDIGELIELTLPGLDEPGRFLKAVCPRNGLIVEGVPRVSDIDGLPINTALAAQAWRIGDPQSEYTHPPVRT